MNATALRTALVVAVLMGSGGLAGMVLSEEDPSPRKHGTADDMFGQEGSLPFGPVVLDDNAILMRVTNLADEERDLSVSVNLEEGAINEAGAFRADIYRGPDGEGLITTLLYGSSEGWGPGLVGVQHGGYGVSAPISLRDVYDVVGFFEPTEIERTREVTLTPGPHILFLATSHWAAQWEMFTTEGDPEDFSWEIVHEDSDMFHRGYSNAPGHWDEVHTEVYSRGGGMTHASTLIEINYPLALVYVGGSQLYNELQTEDGAGTECEAAGSPRVDPNNGFILAYLATGQLKIEGLTVAANVPKLVYEVVDVPLDYEREPGCIEFPWDFPPGSGRETSHTEVALIDRSL